MKGLSYVCGKIEEKLRQDIHIMDFNSEKAYFDIFVEEELDIDSLFEAGIYVKEYRNVKPLFPRAITEFSFDPPQGNRPAS